ncbi:MAG: DUF2291 domain-containing protein [Cereibacter sphaeroides]|uniref:DUF2291 domain-containing protein n=1 Tax=Cereibacter sphaeroides TaxID=1063 RepID=A0A2W5U1N2_CERSP|nr:MAG: DUF2291 domain-containing protein [Cereibacter sphaeroides]
MTRFSLLALCAVLALGLPSCKIVKNKAPGEGAIAADASGDDARTAAILDQTYDAELLPLIRDKAMPVADLRTAIAGGLDAAGAAHGNRGSGEGAAWNFAVKGEGTVISANLESRSRVADLDTDGDGTADLKLQLGPVVKGTALRDVAPFYKFDDFRDQIAFAKLGRALNDKASAALVLPEGGLVGQKLNFLGVVALKSPTEPWLVTVTEIGPGQ